MMKSCFTYGHLFKDAKYIANYKEQLSNEMFNKVFNEYEIYLKENYIIHKNVGRDSEGSYYNYLEKK